MVVTVRLHTTLRRAGPEGTVDRLVLDLAPGATVQAVLNALGIVLRDDAVLLVVNNRIAGAETVLTGGDEVRLIPAMSGGSSPDRPTVDLTAGCASQPQSLR